MKVTQASSFWIAHGGHPGSTHPAPSVAAWWCGARGRELANHGGLSLVGRESAIKRNGLAELQAVQIFQTKNKA